MSARLILSRHVSFVSIGPDLIVCGHSFKGPRNVVDAEGRAHLEAFREARDIDVYVTDQVHARSERERLLASIRVWERQGILVDADADEDDRLARELGPDVEDVKAAVVRAQMRARHDPRWRFRLAPTPAPSTPRVRWRVVYLGACLLLPSLDAVVEAGARSGIDVDGAASFSSDVALIDEHQPDFIVIGDLPRVGFGWHDRRPVQYVDGLRATIAAIRARSSAPILVRNFIVPTCSLGGLSDRGADSHVNKARALNVDIARLADEVDDLYIVDVDQALALAGKQGLVDDMVVLSHHLASLTWLVERAERERVPDTSYDVSAMLRDLAPRERLELEYLLATEDLRVMRTIAGVDRRKLVVVDLDEVLWPGILAETGTPFRPEVGTDVFPYHLYLGLHEALLALRERGILLACVSKNDEEVVRDLWRYAPGFSSYPALTLNDFVTYRIDWNDKADNLAAIAAELGVSLDAVAYIDDSARERANVAERHPEVMVLGENPFAVRWALLTDPAFDVPRVTDEARARSVMVRGQLERERFRAGATDPQSFRKSLDLRCTLRRETDARHHARIAELLGRTTQLNTTGEPPVAQLGDFELYTLAAIDRFVDYGLVGVCLVRRGVAAPPTIWQLVLSCRVLGLGLEDLLLQFAAADAVRRFPATGADSGRVAGRLVKTSRNHPARSLFARAGWTADPEDDDRWWIDRAALGGAPATDTPYSILVEG